VFPEGLPIIIFLLDVLHDFVVRQNLFEFVFTDKAFELLQQWVVSNILLVVIKNLLDDPSSVTKSTVIFLHGKGSSDKITCVKTNHRLDFLIIAAVLGIVLD
jgi:hypothetical protein